jgi:hypothetical protein
MTTISEIDRQIAELQAKKAELELKMYYTPMRSVCAFRVWEDEAIEMQSLGLMFRTSEAAELRRKQMIVTQKLRDIRGDWKPDWSDKNKQEKFTLFWDSLEGWKISSCNYYPVIGAIFFPTKEAAERTLALGDELNVLLEGN